MQINRVQLVGSRYQIKRKLGAGAMGVVYEAYDRLYRRQVALKQVITQFGSEGSTADANASTDTRLALANEFQVLSSLKHPHIIGVSDYGFHQGQPYYTMQFLESSMTIREFAEGKPLSEKIRVLVEMLQALQYLHQRGVIHRDLKPDNALVSSDGSLNVLDFGLATLYESKTDDGSIAGTIAYMAPEVLQGESVSAASDLYAVGTMAYEIFAGHRPFTPTNVGTLIFDIVQSIPDIDAMDVSEEIAVIVARLLAKTSEDRYPDAGAVIRALNAVTTFDIPDESIEIRESYLQAAQFVGRETELQQLTDALDRVVENKGSSWLIGGESGVGKSRLVSEIRTLALVKGALVLDGQSIAEGGLSYQLWLNPLRRLALSTELEDDNAGVLKQILPDIEQLLGRDILDAPPLEGKAGQRRLIDTITYMFLKYEHPIVLILEDVQWSDESLDVVKAMIEHLQNEPVMMIGTFRSDERPSLPDEVEGMETIILGRLDDNQIADLSASILGEAGRDKAIIDLLNRETEGNVFFLVEVVRALAEHAGRLSNIRTMTLPAEIFAKGIVEVIERRLAQVPASARDLLQTAAIAGRQLDLEVLKHLAANTDLDNWLMNCANAAVIEGIDGQWRFSHEKLREGITTSIPETAFQQKHHRIADSLIHVYTDLHDEYATLISDHYDQAQAVDEAAKWHLVAAKHAKDTFASVTGVEHSRKALTYWLNHRDEPSATETLITIYRELGLMLFWQAEFDEATEIYSELLTLAEEVQNREHQVRACWGLAWVNVRSGNPKDSFDYAEKGRVLAQDEQLLNLVSELLVIQGMCQYSLGDLQAGRKLVTQALEISESHQHDFELAQALNVRGILDMNLGIFDEAEDDFIRALAIFEQLGTRPSAMSVVNNLGLIAIFRGEYQKAVERYQDAIRRAQEVGENHNEMEFTSNLGEALIRVEEFDEAIKKLEWVVHQSERRGFDQISETFRFLAEAYLGLNQFDKALESAENALKAGYDVDYQEFIAGALNVLGQVLAISGVSSVIQRDQSEPVEYTASKCFKDADAMYIQLGMAGERARNLRSWAQYEIDANNKDFGLKMWQEARELFVQQGADAEVKRMDSVQHN